MGRPPKPLEKKQGRNVMLRLTESEYQALQDRSERDGLGLAETARQILLRSLKRGK